MNKIEYKKINNNLSLTLWTQLLLRQNFSCSQCIIFLGKRIGISVLQIICLIKTSKNSDGAEVPRIVTLRRDLGLLSNLNGKPHFEELNKTKCALISDCCNISTISPNTWT